MAAGWQRAEITLLCGTDPHLGSGTVLNWNAASEAVQKRGPSHQQPDFRYDRRTRWRAGQCRCRLMYADSCALLAQAGRRRQLF